MYTHTMIFIFLPSLSFILTLVILTFPILTPQVVTNSIMTLNVSLHSTMLSSAMVIVNNCVNSPAGTVTVVMLLV